MGARIVAIGLVTAALVSGACAPALADPPTDFGDGVVAGTNAIRQQNNLPPWNPDPRLAVAALAHSQAMAAANLLVHQVPGEPDPGTRITNAGVNWLTWGENLAVQLYPDQTPDMMLQAWMQDASHRVNLLDPNFTDVGVGVFAVPTAQGKFDFWVTEDAAQEPPPPKPSLDAKPASLDFKQVTLATIKPLRLTVTNTSPPGANQALSGTIVVTSGAPEFSVDTPTFNLKRTDPPLKLIVSFDAVNPGPFTGEVTVTCTSDPQVPPIKVPLKALAVDPNGPRIVVIPPNHDWGKIAIGKNQPFTFQVMNAGTGNLKFKVRPGGIGPAFNVVAPQAQYVVPTAGQVPITVSAHPPAAKQYGPDMVITTNVSVPGEVKVLVGLECEGFWDQPKIEATPDPLEMGKVTVNSVFSKPVSVENIGGKPLTIASTTIVYKQGEKNRWLKVLPHAQVIQPGGQPMGVSVFAEPTSAGSLKAWLRIKSDDPTNGTLDVPITVEGVKKKKP